MVPIFAAARERVYHDRCYTADAVRTEQSTCWPRKLQESIHALRSFLLKKEPAFGN